jgi:hypothetical protein
VAAVAERFQRDVRADLAAVLEAIGDRLGRVVDTDLHAVDVVLVDPLEASLPRKPHDPERELSRRERLRQVAATRGQEPLLVLTRYGVERFLYRLSRIPAG